MPHLFHSLLAAALATALPLAAIQAQTRKPAPKPAARPVAKPVAKPVVKTAPAPAPRPAAAPAPAPEPVAPPARRAPTAAAASSGPFEVGTNALNVGIGLGTHYAYGIGSGTSVTPALSVSFERGVLPLGPGVLGIGAFVGYQSASYEYSGFKDKFTDILVTVRGAFHYPVSDKFDAYGGVGLGLRRLGYSTNYTGPYNVDYSSTGAASGLFVGGRYFFAPNIGAFAELGYDQSYLKLGLSAKF